MATRRLLQAASRRLRLRGARSGGSGRAASDDARIVERATRGQVEMRQFGIESLGGAGMHAPHVAIFGAGFVGVNTALALLQRNIASRVTLTDVDKEKWRSVSLRHRRDPVVNASTASRDSRHTGASARSWTSRTRAPPVVFYARRRGRRARPTSS